MSGSQGWGMGWGLGEPVREPGARSCAQWREGVPACLMIESASVLCESRRAELMILKGAAHAHPEGAEHREELPAHKGQSCWAALPQQGQGALQALSR